jgi:hypothetical protein
VIAVELTVGRHTAGDGAGVDPIVAAALSRRPASAEPRHGSRRLTAADSEGGLGWPGDPADGTGLGWPADLRTTTQAADAPAQAAVALVAEDVPARRRGGWRRLFGGGGHSSAA